MMKTRDKSGNARGESLRRVRSATIIIAIAAILLRVWNLSGPDMANDEAHYAFRAVGYVDYVASVNLQSTPATWFDAPRWWQRLSFHDAPPLVFLAERLSFLAFGVHPLAARMPFVIAGLATVAATFFLARFFGGLRAGLIGAGALAISNYHVWASRIGYLDGFVALFVALALYWWLRAQKDPRAYLWWGISCGLGILAKYTFLFMAPVFLVGFFTREPRPPWRNARFWTGVILLVLLVSPLIVYNGMMWRERGHPDAALSTLLGMHPDDFRGLTRSVHANPLRIGGAVSSIAGHMSIGFIALLLTALGALSFWIWRNPTARKIYAPLLVGLFSGLVMLVVIGDHQRYGTALLPLMASAMGAAGAEIWNMIRPGLKPATIALTAVIAAGELFFTVSSQLVASPLARYPFSSRARPSWQGYAEIDRYVENFYDQFPQKSDIVIFSAAPQLAAYQEARIRKNLAANPRAPRQEHLLVFDDRMDWFSSVWIFERRRLYDQEPIHSLMQFLETADKKGVGQYAEFGLRDVTFIISEEPQTSASGREPHPRPVAQFAGELKRTARPIDVIRRPDTGGTAFTVFRLPLAAFE